MRRDEFGIDHEEAAAWREWWKQHLDQRKAAADKGEVASTDDSNN